MSTWTGRRLFSSGHSHINMPWRCRINLYSAPLLPTFSDLMGTSRGMLRSTKAALFVNARLWLWLSSKPTRLENQQSYLIANASLSRAQLFDLLKKVDWSPTFHLWLDITLNYFVQLNFSKRNFLTGTHKWNYFLSYLLSIKHDLMTLSWWFINSGMMTFRHLPSRLLSFKVTRWKQGTYMFYPHL